jgi:hypothetical protein
MQRLGRHAYHKAAVVVRNELGVGEVLRIFHHAVHIILGVHLVALWVDEQYKSEAAGNETNSIVLETWMEQYMPCDRRVMCVCVCFASSSCFYSSSSGYQTNKQNKKSTTATTTKKMSARP